MNQVAATQLITKTFNAAFDEQVFENFIANLLNQVDRGRSFGYRSGNIIPQAFREHLSTYRRPFIYTDPNGERMDVLVVRVRKGSGLERARTMQRNFVAWYLKQDHDESVEAALIAFYHQDISDWRFSFVRLEYAFGDEGAEEKLTPVRRYSFLVGLTEPTHTAASQLRPFLIEDAVNPTIEDLANAFQVEVVSKQFFEEYKELFLQLVEGIDAVLEKDKAMAVDFKRAEIHVPNFAKKLLGQIVFLYFVQKKGWLGVAPGEMWGSGPKDFMRRLLAKQSGVTYRNFFNDVLEPLFYDALAVRRDGDLFAIGGFTCQIPFLNGGLFEPMGGYDWQHTSLFLPDTLFSNRKNDDDDAGTGVLDVFDRYNFTVWEEEPLEKEVAVDPEMLGKVFENLLEVQDRKSKGAFYTPREIVHYMCQESLINYLDTAVNMVESGLADENPVQATMFGDTKPQQIVLKTTIRVEQVPRKDISILVRQGALALQQDAAKEAGLKSGDYVLPKTVRDHARELDEALATIKLCDPAIGSGAFPVGMLHEIIQARQALGTYLGEPNRPPYPLKWQAIQESIYGVDIDAGAVDIAKLRLWLSLVVDEENYDDIQPLPNLDYKIVCGNSLLGVEINLFNNHLFVRLGELKQIYFEETHQQEKLKLKSQIEQLIEMLTGEETNFDFEVYFHEVFAEQNGFDVVIGNPPYGLVFDTRLKAAYENKYPTFRRNNDLYVAFYQLSCGLLNLEGNLSLISPNTFLNGDYFSALRKMLTQKLKIQVIRDFKEVPVFDDPTVFVCVFNASKSILSKYPYTVNIQTAQGDINNFDSGWFEIEKSSNAPFKMLDPIMANFSDPQKFWCIDDLFYVKDVGFNYWSKGRGKKRGGSIGTRVFYQGQKKDRRDIPFLKGRNINRWFITEPDNFLRYNYRSFLDPEIDTFRYSAGFLERIPKVVYRQTSDTIIAAIDNSAHHLNKSAHLIVPKVSWTLMSPEMLIGILNSSLFKYLYSYISQETKGRAFAQVKTTYIKRLPLPRSFNGQHIETDVNKIIRVKHNNPDANVSDLEKHLDRLVYDLFGIDIDEIALIEKKLQG